MYEGVFNPPTRGGNGKLAARQRYKDAQLITVQTNCKLCRRTIFSEDIVWLRSPHPIGAYHADCAASLVGEPFS